MDRSRSSDSRVLGDSYHRSGMAKSQLSDDARTTKKIGQMRPVEGKGRTMKFHAAILQPNGKVTANECRDSAALNVNAFSRKVMAEFKQALREKLTADPIKTGKFRATFGDIRHILEWQQVEPLSAMGKFVVRGKTAAASFYYHGFAPDLDEAVLQATEALFVRWFGRKSQAACRGLRSVKERPVVIVMPASKEILRPRRLANHRQPVPVPRGGILRSRRVSDQCG